MATISGTFVWTLFQIHDKSDAFAECLICSKKIKRGRESAGQKAFSTTPLHNHLKKPHPDEYKKVLMQFFTQLIFLDRTLELILLICFVRCGKAGASLNLADNCLFGMEQQTCAWVASWQRLTLSTVPFIDFSLSSKMQSCLNVQL